jgi:protein-tyrosine phosphatase
VTDVRTFDGLVNFRDLGGLPVAGGGRVRDGVLFRSDSLHYASDADAEHLIDVLNIATVIDLREPAEIADFGRGPVGEAGLGYLNLPIGDVPTATTRAEFYLRVIAAYGPGIADLIRMLARPDTLPAVIHCHVGCDRTGAVAATILSLIGVPEPDVAADYARSWRANDVIRQRARARRAMLGLPLMDDAYYAAWDPRAEIMAETLDLIRERWGGIDGWADDVGLTAVDVAAIRSALVEPALEPRV